MAGGPSLIAVLGLDGRGYEKELEKQGKKTDDFASHVREKIGNGLEMASGGNFVEGLVGKLLGGIGGGALFTIGKEIADHFNQQVKDIRIGTLRTGIDPDTFQRISNVLTSMDTPMDAFTKFMDHVAQKQEEAKAGGVEGGKALKEFAILGASSADVMSESYQELSIQIFKFLKGIELTGDKIAALKSVGGRGGAEIIPGAQVGLDSVTANKGIISDDDLRKAIEMKKAAGEAGSFWVDVGKKMAKVFNVLVKYPYQGYASTGEGIGKALGGGDSKLRDRLTDARMGEFRDKDEGRRLAQNDVEEQDRYLEKIEADLEKARTEADFQQADKDQQNQVAREHATASERYQLEQRIFGIRQKSLTDLGREAALQAEIKKHIEEANLYKKVGLDFEAADEANAAAEKGAELASLYQQQTFKPFSDQLSRIGGYTGTSGFQTNTNEAIRTKVEAILSTIRSGILIKG